ncbi:hypothetical protein D3C74_401780 [compost metagenome]
MIYILHLGNSALFLPQQNQRIALYLVLSSSESFVVYSLIHLYLSVNKVRHRSRNQRPQELPKENDRLCSYRPCFLNIGDNFPRRMSWELISALGSLD